MKKSIQMFLLFLLPGYSIFAQEFKMLDQLGNGRIDHFTMVEGKRFYLTPICDTLWVNGQMVVAKDSCLLSATYLISINGDGTLNFAKNMGECQGNLVATDSSITLFMKFNVDTLFSADTFFVKAVLPSWENIVAFEYSIDGDLIRAKQWTSTTASSIGINELSFIGGNYFLTGSFYGVALKLDDQYSDAIAPFQGFNTQDVFTIKINGEWECEWIDMSGGLFREFHGASATNSQKSTISTGNFSSGAFACDQDTVYNPYSFFWPDMWVSKIDANGQCEWLRSVNDINSVTGVGTGFLSDGSVVVGGHYRGDNADFGDTTLTAPYDNTNSFIAKYTSFGKFEFAAQFGGEAPIKITDLAIGEGDAIWVCGDFFSDTIRKDPTIGQFVLPTIAEGYDAFIVKFDKKGNALFALSMGGKGTDFATGIERGPGNKLYLKISTMSDTLDINGELITSNFIGSDLYIEITDIPTQTSETSPAPIAIKIYPNPVSNNQIINYEITAPENIDFQQIKLYSIYGQLISQYKINDKKGQVELPHLFPGIYLIKFENKNGMGQVQKLIVE
ncbi:MAG: T9SS type A sorting domain-containing protein [Saprospiraceae bacterium]